MGILLSSKLKLLFWFFREPMPERPLLEWPVSLVALLLLNYFKFYIEVDMNMSCARAEQAIIRQQYVQNSSK